MEWSFHLAVRISPTFRFVHLSEIAVASGCDNEMRSIKSNGDSPHSPFRCASPAAFAAGAAFLGGAGIAARLTVVGAAGIVAGVAVGRKPIARPEFAS